MHKSKSVYGRAVQTTSTGSDLKIDQKLKKQIQSDLVHQYNVRVPMKLWEEIRIYCAVHRKNLREVTLSYYENMVKDKGDLLIRKMVIKRTQLEKEKTEEDKD